MMFPTLLLSALLAAPASFAQEPPPAVDEAALPVAAHDLLALRAFSLEGERDYPWMRDHPPIREGVLLALEVEPALAAPRQVEQPVIYVGDVPAERLNSGWPSGRLLLLVPGEPDLSELPVFFGPPELPERVDAVAARLALADATAAGVLPFSEERVRAAATAGGEALSLRDARALEHAVADWIDAWAPGEEERAANLRAPAP
jgi:hypothetical protein